MPFIDGSLLMPWSFLAVEERELLDSSVRMDETVFISCGHTEDG